MFDRTIEPTASDIIAAAPEPTDADRAAEWRRGETALVTSGTVATSRGVVSIYGPEHDGDRFRHRALCDCWACWSN